LWEAEGGPVATGPPTTEPETLPRGLVPRLLTRGPLQSAPACDISHAQREQFEARGTWSPHNQWERLTFRSGDLNRGSQQLLGSG